MYRHSPIRLSPRRRRSLSPVRHIQPYRLSYGGISISPREPKCQKFKAEDEIAGDENTSRCYEPEYDLNTKNAGDRSDLVRWAILNGYGIVLMPEFDDKFPYDDIEFLMVCKLYLKKALMAVADFNNPKSSHVQDLHYIKMITDAIRLKKLELYAFPKTPLQKEVANLLKRFEPNSLYWRHDEEDKYKPCSALKSDKDITTFGCYEKDPYNHDEEHSFELTRRNIDIVKQIEKDFMEEVKRSGPAEYKKLTDRAQARIENFRQEIKANRILDWNEEYDEKFMKKQIRYLSDRDQKDYNEKNASFFSKIFA
jgi:hypothetical protein